MNTNNSSQSLFSGVFGFGVPQAIYPVKKFSRWGNLILGLVFAGGGLLAIVGSAVYTFYQINRFGPAIQDRMFSNTLFPLSCVGLGMILVGALSIWGAYNNWKKAAAAYRDGFAYSDRKGVRQYRWTDIQSMTSAVTRRYTNGIYTGTTHIYTLMLKDDQKIVFNDSLQKVEELADIVQRGIFPHTYKAAVDQYNNGRPVAFGIVSISKSGITIGKKEFGWGEVQQVAIQKGILSVQKKGGGWFSGATAAASTIPNLPVLLSIVNEVTGVKYPQK